MRITLLTRSSGLIYRKVISRFTAIIIIVCEYGFDDTINPDDESEEKLFAALINPGVSNDETTIPAE
jgi:hypothetical protein